MITQSRDYVFPSSNVKRIRELTFELGDGDRELAMFFDLCPDLLCIVSSDGYFVKLNKAWQRELGWSIQELTERPFIDFVHPEDVRRTTDIMRNMRSCQAVRFCNRYRIKGSDKYVVLEWNATNWYDGSTYAVAREVPQECLSCQNTIGRFE